MSTVRIAMEKELSLAELRSDHLPLGFCCFDEPQLWSLRENAGSAIAPHATNTPTALLYEPQP